MSIFERQYQTVVVGAGVAGCHAAIAAASGGAETLMLTSSWDTVSCLAWGPRLSERLVNDIRCPGGLTKKAVKRTVIFKGFAGKEAVLLVDGYAYQAIWKHQLEKAAGIEVFQDTCTNIRRLTGGWRVETGWGASFVADTVVVAVGTFLGATVQVGGRRFPGGRPGETSEEGLFDALRGLGAPLNPSSRSAAPIINGPIEWEQLELTAVSDPSKEKGEHTGGVSGLYAFGVEENVIYIEPVSGFGDQYYLETRLKAPSATLRTAARSYSDRPAGCSAGPAAGAELAKSLTEAEICAVRGLEKTRVIRPAYEVGFYRLGLVDAASELNDRGLYFAGQIAGATRYEESAEQGLRAGKAAAKHKQRSVHKCS